jgi:hypothetical protein
MRMIANKTLTPKVLPIPYYISYKEKVRVLLLVIDII